MFAMLRIPVTTASRSYEAVIEHGLLYRARAAGLKIEVLEELLTLRRIHDANTTTRQGSSLPLMFTSVRDHLRSRR